MLLYAAGGVMQVTGDPERGPIKLGLYAPLFFAGCVIAGMLMGALRSSLRDGQGERVEISIHEVLTASMDRGGPNIVAYQYSGALMIERVKNVGLQRPAERRVPVRRRLRTGRDPAGVVPSHVPRHGPRGPAWRTSASPREPLQPGLPPGRSRRSSTRGCSPTPSRRSWRSRRPRAGRCAPSTRLRTPTATPHTGRATSSAPSSIPVAGTYEYPGLPIRFKRTPGEMRVAPLLGEHTFEVLTERLSHTPEEVAILGQRGVI